MARRLDGETVVMTGATGTIGQVIAFELYGRGATLVLGVRSLAKGLSLQRQLEDQMGDKGRVDVLSLEMSSFPLIRGFAKSVVERHRSIKLLINAAATIESSRVSTLDDLEQCFGVNYMGHFLLTQLLVRRLRAAAPSRVVNITCSKDSKKRYQNWGSLMWSTHYDPLLAYNSSCRAMTLFSRELARRVNGMGITVLTADPGPFHSPLGQQLVRGFLARQILHLRSPASAALTPLYCALAPGLEIHTGECFQKRRKKTLLKKELEIQKEHALRLWRISMGILAIGICPFEKMARPNNRLHQ